MMPHTCNPCARRVSVSRLLLLVAASVASTSCNSKASKKEPAPSAPPLAQPRSGEPSAPPAPSKRADKSDIPAPREWNFEDTEVGAVPEGWSAPAGEWRVETSEQAPSGSRVLVQRASNPSPVFNLALVEESLHVNVDITARVRARQGRIDQGGGVVWRAQDASNYYIARYNPLEDNYRVYTIKDGRRRELASADVQVDSHAWHTLRVRMVGDHIECFLNGEKHLDVRDSTFTNAGMVGLWTKADAQTEFDDLSVSSDVGATP